MRTVVVQQGGAIVKWRVGHDGEYDAFNAVPLTHPSPAGSAIESVHKMCSGS